ncbi:hypothetical protein A2781_02520 [Candidatus Gottesmanbacteria bacterium RIFCSPHIGHO2_01_FULL_42_27]|uniref:LytR/CpsA/Psr regulator C-terminal domain-containing protein n=1 Tax=Candidatus Gottesmanbacteria bacterium RIFCSPLOWO2_01_FULL_42_22 TaxID=1798391 RepID=A0A1F6BCK2_9BACT|nr:MAG: hypothetical protein UV46_C0018G0016 [Candidatus Gottesmanbacteria bacterium GW2011_GWC2_42_8]OGG09168.1 MAG: hypothetical protein A2781_02520 [Candidatus Gottesmanbacteria bacterium RIFCSPHIGHO2_01_FULL_42_27]OGG20763.1 MAG: hypothetical protein A3E72_06135 [Candidatus Gottesmanbacteria bacterium RIFCSPHIGHO2_12_FULL_43_26]OGG34655.1 MAG: hypothetical protein A2968_01620 [Candidatus Gottesmanbacteria bacterium RIFCSPLOWO2_01_FULL_42_22]OGG35566.1 MAG: hypothetical protein A3G68_04505 [
MALNEYDFKKIGLFLLYLLIFFAAVSGSVGSLFYYSKYKDTEERLKQATLASGDNVNAIIAKVGKLIKLPEDELPTIATISDLDKLKGQPFFARAKVGDKVLLYTQAKKAILYDPKDNVIIEVGPLVMPSGSPAPSISGKSELTRVSATPAVAGASVSAGIQVAILNGTKDDSLANTFARDLAKKMPEILIVSSAKAKIDSYEKTLIVDLFSQKSRDLPELAKAAGAEIADLPPGETKPLNADILIILGRDLLAQP